MAEAAPPMASPAGWVNYKVDSTARGETMYATSLLAMAAIGAQLFLCGYSLFVFSETPKGL
ncbi:hypothetical protein CC2G_001832 [Coprinopsis cinerea AmutBmut pab1-1]|nr:hypothetical protein CC2G_001832 [Coprinopsis cinerea AmutBmut pab1-1]